MKLNDQVFDIENNLETVSSEFEIAANAKMFDILSNKIYENPIRAIVRELSCNAIDANIEANNNEPFKIYFPDNDKQSLIIEDTGIGMTHEDVMTVYKSYGKSTKSNSNKVIGALGLGGKTPLSYTQQFTLSTAKDGTLNNYIIYKDENGIPNVTLVSSKETDLTGTSIEVIVKGEDVRKFYQAAIQTFLFFHKMPIILRGEETFYRVMGDWTYGTDSKNIKELYEKARRLVSKDFILESSVENNSANKLIKEMLGNNGSLGVVMGQVYYNVRSDQILDRETYDKNAEVCIDFPSSYNVRTINKIKHVPLGSISFQPSRESLNYNKVTIQNLQKIFYSDFENWHKNLLAKANTPEKLFKNYTKLPYLNYLYKTFEKTVFGPVSNVSSIYDMGLEYFRDKIVGKNLIFVAKRKKGNIYELSDFEHNKDLISRMYRELIIEDRVERIIVADEDKIVEKLNTFNEKTIKKNKNWFCSPAAVKEKLLLLADDFTVDTVLIIDETANILFKKYFNIETKLASELIVPKTVNTGQRGGIRGKNENLYKAWDLRNGRFVSMDQIKGNNLTYEVFNGVPNQRGWWYDVDMNKLKVNPKANQAEVLTVLKSGPYKANYNKGDLFDVYAKENNIDVNHYIVNWSFFKKYVYGNKKWTFIYDFAHKYFSNNFSNIEKDLTTFNLHGFSFVNCATAQTLLDEGISKYPYFENTLFGKECARIIDESLIRETNVQDRKNKYNKTWLVVNTMSNYFTNNDKFIKLLNQFKYLQTKFDNMNTDRIDYVTPVLERYPIFQMIDRNNFSSNKYKEIIVDYIAEKEGLQ